MRRARQRGQVTAFVAVIAPALLLAVGLSYDGGETVRAILHADDVAEEAARAGARTIDLSTFHRSGTIVADPAAAVVEARAYLTQNGLDGAVRVSGDRVLVSVDVKQPMLILGLGGLWTVTVVGHGEAQMVHGVEAPEA